MVSSFSIEGNETNPDDILLALRKFRSSILDTLDEYAEVEPSDEYKVLIDEIGSELNVARNRIEQLKQYLPPFSLRQALSVLNSLDQEFSVTSRRLIPRKRFTFASRKLYQKRHHELQSALEGEQERQRDDLVLTDLKDETVVRHPGELGGADFTLERLENCVIILNDHLRAIAARDLVGCRIQCPGVSGAVHLTNCVDCTFSLACHQLRMHDSRRLRLELFCANDPIIEYCSDVLVGPLADLNGNPLTILTEAHLEDRPDRGQHVQDFKWMRETKSPNWRYVDGPGAVLSASFKDEENHRDSE